VISGYLVRFGTKLVNSLNQFFIRSIGPGQQKVLSGNILLFKASENSFGSVDFRNVVGSYSPGSQGFSRSRPDGTNLLKALA